MSEEEIDKQLQREKITSGYLAFVRHQRIDHRVCSVEANQCRGGRGGRSGGGERRRRRGERGAQALRSLAAAGGGKIHTLVAEFRAHNRFAHWRRIAAS